MDYIIAHLNVNFSRNGGSAVPSIDVTCPPDTNKYSLPKKKSTRSNRHLWSRGEVRVRVCDMESSEDVEVLSRAIEKLLDEKRKREAVGNAFIEDHEDQLLLSRLISQLESPKKEKTDGTPKEEEQSSDSSPSKGKREGHRRLEESIKEIAKDIENVKRQNTITHVLLSAMIFLTLAWQLSEYSMIFMMKETVSHPISSIGGMFNGMFKGKLRPIKNQLAGTEQNNNENGTNTGAHLQMPELLREIGFNDDEE